MQIALLLQLQYGVGDLIAPRRARRRADAVALGVEQAADLHELAVALTAVLVGGRLEEVGVAAALDSRDALLGRLDEHARIAAHEVPHALVRLYL